MQNYLLGFRLVVGNGWDWKNKMRTLIIQENGRHKENEHFREVTTKRTPVRRWASPEEFREVGAFLADPSQTFHTGQQVCVDGGYTIF